MSAGLSTVSMARSLIWQSRESNAGGGAVEGFAGTARKGYVTWPEDTALRTNVMSQTRLSRRQAAFRADFRTRIAPGYFGWAHVALIAALGLSAIWYCASQVRAPAWYEFLVIPFAF